VTSCALRLVDVRIPLLAKTQDFEEVHALTAPLAGSNVRTPLMPSRSRRLLPYAGNQLTHAARSETASSTPHSTQFIFFAYMTCNRESVPKPRHERSVGKERYPTWTSPLLPPSRNLAVDRHHKSHGYTATHAAFEARAILSCFSSASSSSSSR
jgi:hypothetical protein